MYAGEVRKWELIELSGLIPRTMLAVATLNSFEIVIMGGFASPSVLSDVYIFGKKSVDKIASENRIKMVAGPYPCAKIDQNLVLTANYNEKRFI